MCRPLLGDLYAGLSTSNDLLPDLSLELQKLRFLSRESPSGMTEYTIPLRSPVSPERCWRVPRRAAYTYVCVCVRTCVCLWKNHGFVVESQYPVEGTGTSPGPDLRSHRPHQ